MKNNTKRFKNAKIAIIVALITSIILLTTHIFYNIFLSNLDSETIFDLTTNTIFYELNGLAMLLFGIVYIISAVIFILWFRRCYYNLCLKVDYLKHSEGWAAGGWFTPVMNLYVPYQIMKSIVVEYQLILGIGINDKKHKNIETFVGVWWACYLISGFIFNFSDNVLSETLEGQISNNNLIILAVVLTIGAGVILLYIMNKIGILEDNIQLMEDIDTLNEDDSYEKN